MEHASIYGASGLDDDAPSIAAPWDINERQDSVWLESRGFRWKHLLQPHWTDQDLIKFYGALDKLGSGDATKPTQNMRLFYYLSFHVMGRRFSPKACWWLFNSTLRKIRKGNLQAKSLPAAAPKSKAHSSDIHNGAETDSEDEVNLHLDSGSDKD